MPAQVSMSRAEHLPSAGLLWISSRDGRQEKHPAANGGSVAALCCQNQVHGHPRGAPVVASILHQL